MGRHSTTGGVIALGHNRIQFEFKFEGRRYRPTLLMTPTALNLRRARENLQRIKARIAAGTSIGGRPRATTMSFDSLQECARPNRSRSRFRTWT
jgi:Arm DNA-binding domain